MTKVVHYSTKAKKDLKRYRNNVRLMRGLYDVLEYLVKGLPLPATYFPHKLSGNYAGCMECHIESDFLLIWIDEQSDTVEIVRIGSHSELF